MRDNRTVKPEPQANNGIDISFHKIRGDHRIVLWMASASLVTTIILVIGVFFMGIRV